MTLAILDARDKEYVVVAAGADLIATYVQQAILAGQTAQEVLDAILAAGLSEGVFPSEAAGLSGTTDGQYFWVGSGGTVTLYLNDTGTGDEIAELATAASLVAATTFQQAGTGALSRNILIKARERVSLADYAAIDALADGHAPFDVSAALNAAIAEGFSRIEIPSGQWIMNDILVNQNGVSLIGQSDFNTIIWATGSGVMFQLGDPDNSIAQHLTLSNMTIGATSTYTGPHLINVKSCFQTYIERIRYKDSLANPTEAVIVLDNNDGTSEQPVRVTVRDCYFDGVDYTDGLSHAPIAIWNTGGIQVLVDNTHIQDFEIGCKLGVNPAVDTQYYDAGHPNDDDFFDFTFANNSRYQVGDRGGTTDAARAFDIWKGSGVRVSNSQFYLNNNGPTPALSGQRVAVFNRTGANFGQFSMSQCVVNCNARADHIFKVGASVQVQRIAVNASEFGGMVGGKGMVEMGASAVARTVISPDNLFDNTNNFGPVDQRTNQAISPYNLGTACTHYCQVNDGAARTFSAFSNGTIGVNYVIQFEITSGSTVTLTAAAAGAYSGVVVDGFAAGSIALQDGDILLVDRGPLAAAEYYRAKLIRGGAVAASAVFLVPGALPAGAPDGTVITDIADGKLKHREGGAWVAAT